MPAPGAPSLGIKGYVDAATAAVTSADATLATLQDSMMPIEVGDPELRAGLAQGRELVDTVPRRPARWRGRSAASVRTGPLADARGAGARMSRLRRP
jgi:hypothetical protein